MRSLAGSCQSGSKCTAQTVVCQLINAAASQDQENTRLLKGVSPEVSYNTLAISDQALFVL